MRKGDWVEYEGDMYVIERDYGGGVFLIGNDKSFVDLVYEEDLTPLIPEVGR